MQSSAFETVFNITGRGVWSLPEPPVLQTWSWAGSLRMPVIHVKPPLMWSDVCYFLSWVLPLLDPQRLNRVSLLLSLQMFDSRYIFLSMSSLGLCSVLSNSPYIFLVSQSYVTLFQTCSGLLIPRSSNSEWATGLSLLLTQIHTTFSQWYWLFGQFNRKHLSTPNLIWVFTYRTVQHICSIYMCVFVISELTCKLHLLLVKVMFSE